MKKLHLLVAGIVLLMALALLQRGIPSKSADSEPVQSSAILGRSLPSVLSSPLSLRGIRTSTFDDGSVGLAERLASPYPPVGSREGEREIVERVVLLKQLKREGRNAASDKIYLNVLRGRHPLPVLRQALENFRPALHSLTNADREVLLSRLPPRVIELSRRTEREWLNLIWQEEAARATASGAAVEGRQTDWADLECPNQEEFAEMLDAVHWDGDRTFTCDLSPLGKLGRSLFFLKRLKLEFGPAQGHVGQDLREPFGFLAGRVNKLKFDFSQVTTIAVNQVTKKEISLGSFFLQDSPLESLLVLVHEARHSDKSDQGHGTCAQGDIPRSAGGCDLFLSTGERAGAYSYGLYLSLALARSSHVTPADRDFLESEAFSVLLRRFNHLPPELAQFVDVIAALDEKGELAVLHPFAKEKLRSGLQGAFRDFAYDDRSGGLHLFDEKNQGTTWSYGQIPARYLEKYLPPQEVTYAAKIMLPYGDYAYTTFLSPQNKVHYLGIDEAKGAFEKRDYPLQPDFEVQAFFLGNLDDTYFLSKDGRIFRARHYGNEPEFVQLHESQGPYVSATGGVLRDLLFLVTRSGEIHRQIMVYEDTPPPLSGSWGDEGAPPVPHLNVFAFRGGAPTKQYEEGRTQRALLDQQGRLWIGYYGDDQARLLSTSDKWKKFSFVKLLWGKGELERPGRKAEDEKDFRRRCQVKEFSLDPWFRRPVGLSAGNLIFQGDDGECLKAALPEGLQGRIASFSFHGEELLDEDTIMHSMTRLSVFSGTHLKVTLGDGSERLVRPYEGWSAR